LNIPLLPIAAALFAAAPALYALTPDVEDVEIVEANPEEVVVIADDVVVDSVTSEEITIQQLGTGDCNPTNNSTGGPAMLSHAGGATFLCTQMPPGNWSQLVSSPATVGMYPFLGGNLCLNPFSMVKASAPTSTGSQTTYNAYELGMPGQTLHFQVLYRDPGFGFGSNISSLVSAIIIPGS
jgi:hypothetical protein